MVPEELLAILVNKKLKKLIQSFGENLNTFIMAFIGPSLCLYLLKLFLVYNKII